MTRFALATLTALALAAPIALNAQSPIAPPSTGLLVTYTYWPVQYVQFVGTELPYTMLELDVDATGKQPVYRVVLTERVGGKRIAYTNSDSVLAGEKAQESDAYKTQIAFEAADAQAVGAASTLRLSLADGKPLQWRFVQGSDVSDQGAGLTPIPGPVPVFAYREQAAVAGEGTALQIGDTVSTAEVWTEISKPPYFVAYRGAMSFGSHTTVLNPGKETWTIASAPTELKQGNTWELASDRGNHRTLRIDKADGTHFTITGTDRFQPSTNFTIEASRAADTWSVERVRYAPVKDGDKHFLSLQFTAPLTSTSTASTLDMMIGRKAKMASATLALSGTPDDRTTLLQVQSPAWAKGKSMSEQTVATPTSIIVTAHPAK